jgi:hypothetical protein
VEKTSHDARFNHFCLLSSFLDCLRLGFSPPITLSFLENSLSNPQHMINLGFEWKIQGDDNRNAGGRGSISKEGQSEWKEALPLLRIGDEKVWRAREFLEYWTTAPVRRQHPRLGRRNDV